MTVYTSIRGGAEEARAKADAECEDDVAAAEQAEQNRKAEAAAAAAKAKVARDKAIHLTLGDDCSRVVRSGFQGLKDLGLRMLHYLAQTLCSQSDLGRFLNIPQ